MNVVITSLHISALMIPIITLLILWYQRRGIEIDHVFLFSAGFIFYLVLPYTLTGTDFFIHNHTYSAWQKVFNTIPAQTWVGYFTSLLLFYGSFIAGSWIASKPSDSTVPSEHCRGGRLVLQKIKSLVIQADGIHPAALNVFFAAAIFFIVMFGYRLRDYFFYSYSKSTQIPAFSSFVAAAVLLISLAICAMVYRFYRQNGKRSFLRSLVHPAVISYCIVAFLLVSMGGRVIVISSLMMFMVFFSVYIRRLPLVFSFIFLFSLVLVSHSILLWRFGQDARIFVNPIQEYFKWRWWQGLGINFFSENFNVGYSLIDFLGKYSIPLLRFPIVLTRHLVGLVPSFVFPSKASWVVDFSSLGYDIGSLSGGFNAYVSLVLNFGIVGASLFLFGFSYALQSLKQYARPIPTVVYVLVSGWLAAEFFRDFEQTVIKEMLQFSVLMPLALLVLSRIMKSYASKNSSRDQLHL